VAPFVAAIDLGTTVIKAGIFDLDGRLITMADASACLKRDKRGYVELEAGTWWQLTCDCLKRCWEKSGINPQDVGSLSISSQGISLVPVDVKGNPLRLAISWLDQRADEQAGRLEQALGFDTIFHITGKRCCGTYVLPKLMWLQENEPDVFSAAHRFLMPLDFVVHRLTGRFVTDFSLAGGTMGLDLYSMSWSPEMFREAGVDSGCLATPTWAGSVAGTVTRPASEATGLGKGTRVILGGQDQKCAALAARLKRGQAAVSMGTAAAIIVQIQQPMLDLPSIPCFPHVEPERFVLEGVISTAGASFKWLRGLCEEISGETWTYTRMDELAAGSPSGAGGLFFYPHLAGAGSPLWSARATGGFAGINMSTNIGDMLRAVLEGVAYQIRRNIEVIESSLGEISAVKLFGGGSSGRLWPQIIADVLGKPVVVFRSSQAALTGAALLAVRGLHGGGEDNILLADEWEDVMPDSKSHTLYSECYERYKDIEESLTT